MTARRPYKQYKSSKGIIKIIKRLVYRSIDKIKVIRNKLIFTHVHTLQNTIDFFDLNTCIRIHPPEALDLMTDNYRQMLINADMWSEKLELHYSVNYRYIWR